VISAKDGFRLDIVLSHTARDPASFSKALLLEPDFAWMKGASLGEQVMRSTRWHACLARGAGEEEYAGALEKAALFLEKNAAFWDEFIGGNGEVELILNHAISPQEEEGDKCFELYLAPSFLAHLSTRGIGLRVQGWQGSVEAKESATPPGRASLGQTR